MVKITNEFGEIKKGTIQRKIYQLRHGKQIRREGYTEKKEPSPLQRRVRATFKDAVKWVNSLTHAERNAIKSYFRKSDMAYERGKPSNWYNFAKTIFITRPRLENHGSGRYSITHPAILRVEGRGRSNELIVSYSDLSNILQEKFRTVFSETFLASVYFLSVRTVAQLDYTFSVREIGVITGLEYFDERYFDERYFV